MATVTQTETEEILNHHVSAFIEADVNEILKDFTEKSEILTPDGALKGLNAIRSFLEETFKMVPKGSAFELKQTIIRDNIGYVVWSGQSSFVNIPIGTDTFIVGNDKIMYQTLAAHIVSK